MDKDEEDLTALAAELQRSYNSGKAGDTFLLDVVYADKSLLNFDDFLVLNFQQGDMISKYYRPETEEEAWQILEDTLELVPKTRQTYVALTLPDENGDFHFLYTKTSIIDSAHFDDLGSCSSNTFIQDYVKYLCDISPERIVQDEDSAYEDDDEIKRQFTEYIVNKDFEAAAAYAEDTFDTDYSSYGTYDALSDAQKAFVDDYVQNMDVFWSDYSIKGVRHGSLTVYGDALDYSHDDIDTWYRENNVKDTSGGFYFSTSKLNYLAFSVEMYKCAI
jgi:hypothetical protein